MFIDIRNVSMELVGKGEKKYLKKVSGSLFLSCHVCCQYLSFSVLIWTNISRNTGKITFLIEPLCPFVEYHCPFGWFFQDQAAASHPIIHFSYLPSVFFPKENVLGTFHFNILSRHCFANL